MSYEIIVIGDNVDTQEYNNVVKEKNVSLISFNSKSSAMDACQKFKKNNIYAILYNDYTHLIENSLKEYEPLEEIKDEDIMNYQFKHSEEFLVLNNGLYNNFLIDNEDVKLGTKAPLYGKFLFSNTGCLLINYFENKINCFCSNLTIKFNDFSFDENILNVEFSRNDKFMLVNTENKTLIFDTSNGKIIRSGKYSKCKFDKNESKIYNFDDLNVYDMNYNIIEQHKYKEIASYKSQTFYFIDGKVQKIVYENDNFKNQKLQANVKRIKFLFSDKFGFVYITKKIKENYFYFIEIYQENNIFLINLNYELKDIKVSNDYILTYDISNKITFYKRKVSGFVKIKEICKNDMCIISQSKKVSCIYDYITENLEFYDDCVLRTIYMQRGCNNLAWSYSDLYLSAFSVSSGQIQIFNNNGKLIFKKIFNIFEDFLWRPFYKLEKELKRKISDYSMDEYEQHLNISSASTYNTDVLIAEWKSFLIKKQQLVYNNK